MVFCIGGNKKERAFGDSLFIWGLTMSHLDDGSQKRDGRFWET